MPRIGYARVSSLDQDLDSQLARLKREGCTIIRSEKVSDASRDGRPELATVLQFLRAGDELVVTRPTAWVATPATCLTSSTNANNAAHW